MNCIDRRALILLGAALPLARLHAAEGPSKPGLSGEELQAEAIRISKLLRCPASNNLTLFDSEAAIANELKGQIFLMLRDGKTSEEIIAWMIERYGEQISYMPEMNAGTAALWVAPWAALAAAGGLLLLRMRRSRGAKS